MSSTEREPPIGSDDRDRRRFRADRLTKILLFVSFLSLVTIIGLAMLIQQNNRNTEATQTSVTELRDIVNDTQFSVRHLEDFVTGLEGQRPEEQARNEAISRAVRTVPEIRDILCEQFPTARACQE